MALKVPTGDDADNSLELEIPLPGRPAIVVTVPKLAFMPPKHVKAYIDWLEEQIEREQAWDEWAAEWADKPESDEKPPAPCKKEEIANRRQIQLRWLKPYLSAADFRAVDEHLSVASVQWIFDQLDGKSDHRDEGVTVGESSASVDS